MASLGHRSLIVVALLASALAVQAQRNDFLSRGEMVFSAGGMNYFGDLNDQSMFGTVHPAFGVGVRSRIDSRWALRFEATYGGISAEHDCIARRNLSFRSDIYEAGAVVEFNFASFGTGPTDRQWTPYIFGGLALFHFNPQAQYVDADGNTQWADLRPLHTEGQGTTAYPDRAPYSLTQLSMPFGIGVKWRLGKVFSLAVEYGFRKTWTDYLDDVSLTYVGSDLLISEVDDGAVAAMLADRSSTPNAIGVKRGDDSLDDWYTCFRISLGISLETLFGWMRPERCEQ